MKAIASLVLLYFTVVIEESHGLRLGFAAWVDVGFGCHGEAVLHEKDSTRLHKYQIQQRSTYKDAWKDDIECLLAGPGDFKEDGSRITISSSGIIQAQHNKYQNVILGFKPTGLVLTIWSHDECGTILTCIPTKDLHFVYGQKLRGRYMNNFS